MSEDINIQNDEEIQKALKDFEIKDRADETRKIAQDIEPEKASSMADLVMKHSRGNVKDLRHAEYILLGFIVLAIMISLFLFFNTGNKAPIPSPQSIEKMKTLPTSP